MKLTFAAEHLIADLCNLPDSSQDKSLAALGYARAATRSLIFLSAVDVIEGWLVFIRVGDKLNFAPLSYRAFVTQEITLQLFFFFLLSLNSTITHHLSDRVSASEPTSSEELEQSGARTRAKHGGGVESNKEESLTWPLSPVCLEF